MLSGPADFDGWRIAAARLLAKGIDPSETDWGCADDPLAILTANDDGAPEAAEAIRLDASKAFTDLAKRVIQHQHAVRFALLYRLLWRLKKQPNLLESATDSEVFVAHAMSRAVQEETELVKSSLCFHAVPSDYGPVSVAWFEPHHHILEATAPFFVRRFGRACFSILTPRLSAHWNGRDLVFGQGTGDGMAARAKALGGTSACEEPIPIRAGLRFASIRGDRHDRD
jgi:DNA polymerase